MRIYPLMAMSLRDKTADDLYDMRLVASVWENPCFALMGSAQTERWLFD